MTKHSHILFSYSFDSHGKATNLTNQEVAKELKKEGLSWVHLDAGHKSTKKWLEQEVNYLDHLIIDALTAEETRPRVTEFDGGLLIILRGVNLNKDSEPEDMVSIRMWIDSDRIITMQRRSLKAVSDLCDQINAGKCIKTPGEFLYNLLYQTLFTTSPFLYALGEKVDDLEEKIMSSHNMKFRKDVLQARTQAIVFKRYLAPQRDAIAKLKNSDCSWIDSWTKRHFQENLDLITHLIEEVDEASSRTQILNDELANALSEKLNRNMFKLSLITMIFMPLTFIAGLFGMNFAKIPGADNPYGFYICGIGMVILAFVQYMFFKKKDWF